jgi:hypothetical protein
MASAKMTEMHSLALSIPLQIPGSLGLLWLPGQLTD